MFKKSLRVIYALLISFAVSYLFFALLWVTILTGVAPSVGDIGSVLAIGMLIPVGALILWAPFYNILSRGGKAAFTIQLLALIMLVWSLFDLLKRYFF